MGRAYAELGQLALAAQALRHAFELRDRVSERERLIIESQYYTRVTGELEKAEQVYQLWQQNYPRDPFAYNALGVIYGTLGKYNNALQQTLRAMQVDPNASDDLLFHLGIWYGNLNLLDEAEAAFNQAERQQERGESLLAAHYQTAFLKDDFRSMVRLVE